MLGSMLASLVGAHDPELISIRVDDSDLRETDSVIYTCFVAPVGAAHPSSPSDRGPPDWLP